MGVDVDYESTKEKPGDFGSVVPPQSSLAFMESLTMPDVQEVVISADVRCTECQQRIVDIISRFNETESVVVNLTEKKVIITCKYVEAPKKQIITSQKNLFNKVAVIKRIFGSAKT